MWNCEQNLNRKKKWKEWKWDLIGMVGYCGVNKWRRNGRMKYLEFEPTSSREKCQKKCFCVSVEFDLKGNEAQIKIKCGNGGELFVGMGL